MKSRVIEGGGIFFPRSANLGDAIEATRRINELMEQYYPDEEQLTGYDYYEEPLGEVSDDDYDDYAPEDMDDSVAPIPGFQLDSVPPEASTTGDVDNRPAAVQERIQIHPQIDDDDDYPDYDQVLDQANNIVPRGVEVHSDDSGGTYVRFPEGTPHAEMQRVVDQVARIMGDADPEGVAGYIEGGEDDNENYILSQDEDTEDQDDYTQEDMDDYAPKDMDDYGQGRLG